jgi:hypothetical protein
MKDQVECYAGGSYPEDPRAVIWEGQRYRVQEVLQRRRTPEGLGFLVQCSPEERVFDLFYLTLERRWQIQPR